MSPLLLFSLHLETAVLPLFLAMMVLTQLARARDPGYHTLAARTQMAVLLVVFAVLSVAFLALLYNVSPLLAVELAAGFTLAILHPANALCLFVHLLYLRPWEMVKDNPLLLALPRLAFFVCVISWLIHPNKHPKPNPRVYRALGLLAGFSLCLLLSTLQTPDVSASLSDFFGLFAKSLILFAMCLYFLDSHRSIAELELTIVLSTLSVMVAGFYQFRAQAPMSTRLESVGMFGDPNDLAAVVVLALPFALTPIFKKFNGLASQLGSLLYALFSLVVIWYTNSRGAMLALATQVLAVQARTNLRKKWLWMVLLVTVLGIGYVVVLHVIPRDADEMGASSESRLTYWKAAVNMAVHRPLLGVGYNRYPANYESYASGIKYEWGERTAHSTWLLALAETGVFGGVMFVGFFMTVLRIAWGHRQRWPAQFYALVGYGVAISFLSETYWLYLYLISGLILASASLPEVVNE